MKQRIITGVIAGAGFIAILLSSGNLFSALLVLMALVAFYEFIHMYGMKGTQLAVWIGYISVSYMVIPWERLFNLQSMPLDRMLWLLMALLMAVTVFSKNQTHFRHISILFIGIVYIGFGFYSMEAIRNGEHGLFWSLLLFACIWATDSGAYFTGWAIGKHLLWPTISPKKTIEGALGSVVFSLAAAICFSIYAPEQLPLERAVLLGILISLVSQLGDLAESALKRVQNVKDSGTILPGHGGVLDRVDSWLFVFPFVYMLVMGT